MAGRGWRALKDIDLAVAKGGTKPVKLLLAPATSPTRCSTRCADRGGCCSTTRSTAGISTCSSANSRCATSMPLTARLHRDPLTVPREELLLSKLQIVELTANDQSDVYNLLFHNEVGDGDGRRGGPISASFIARCAPATGACGAPAAEHHPLAAEPGLLRSSRRSGRSWPAGWSRCGTVSTPSRRAGGGGCATRWATGSAGTPSPRKSGRRLAELARVDDAGLAMLVVNAYREARYRCWPNSTGRPLSS